MVSGRRNAIFPSIAVFFSLSSSTRIPKARFTPGVVACLFLNSYQNAIFSGKLLKLTWFIYSPPGEYARKWVPAG
jgi:hypothetical protein